ncbi:kinase [Pontibacillus marinus]|uniref:Uridine kinase n=1 Tax=Pontibacillus marinus BH030004 = DSM 16465 TaxID=1385511 RepID=A0A0A5FX04_9BACI|nr:kinase [Pontibacillus marinus]KGX84444.1 uridine kinase [Pontibacillus marinus BH030004 = DSM 16465]
MKESIHQILKQLPSHLEGRFILGVDGLSRSGKTTLVKGMVQELSDRGIPFQVFHIDDHIAERSKRYGTGYEEWYEYYNLQWDVRWLKDHFFEPMKSSNQFQIPYYIPDEDRQTFQNVKILNRGLVIVEGVFLQRSEWRSYFDSVIYLDCPREKRFYRENEDAQMNKVKFENRYWKAEDYYLQNEDPLKKADLIITG